LCEFELYAGRWEREKKIDYAAIIINSNDRNLRGNLHIGKKIEKFNLYVKLIRG
jgi:hypothetical protein